MPDKEQHVASTDTSAIGLAVDESANTKKYDLENLVEKLPERTVPISTLAPGPYLRQGGTNIGHVQLLLGAAASAELPPILVQARCSRVIDGMHRLAAAKLRGDYSISARFLDCTDEEALILAIQSNTLHGLPLSKADRISGAKRVLDAHPDWSDRAIARIAGLSAKTIASLRNRSTGATLNGKRLGRDGKRRPVAAGEGRRRAAEYILAHPDAPLRQVAREADVSLGTVHDVRARIRRGKDPERDGGRVPAPHIAERTGIAVSGRGQGAARSTPLPDKRHNNSPLAWAAISAKLANDPTIRYTEGGKEFLRWMSLRATHAEEWREFIDAIPLHWLGTIVPIAEGLSEEWSQFADRLKGRQEAAS